MIITYFISHPEADVRPDVPVRHWGLSPSGRRRLAYLLDQPWVAGLTRVAASTERKAIETAQALAEPLQLTVHLDQQLGENDRSATGYLPPAEFETVANEFFARPDHSVRGWETAREAQRRIVGAVARAVDGADGDTAVVAHGGVGTLLLCALMDVPINRKHDQPGQGSYFCFSPLTRRVVHGWRRLPSGR